jgi:hypothetical protein
LRRWGVILLFAAGASLLYGGYVSLRSRAETWTAAAIEDGELPNPYSQLDRRYAAALTATEIVGRLVQADAVVVQRRRSRVYAPLVSDRPGADEHPRIYFGASPAAYDRLVGGNRFRGTLTALPPSVREAFESHGRAVAGAVYLLEDIGFQDRASLGRALVFWGTVLGVLGILALVFAAWRQAAGRSESSDPRPESGGTP